MPPRRNIDINDVYDRIMARMEERLDQFVDQFVDRMNDMMNPIRRGDRDGRRGEGEELEYPFFEGDDSSSDEWRDHDMAGDDYEGPLVFDDDQYKEESMPFYDTDFEDVIEEEEGFVRKEGFGVLDGVVPTTPSKGVEGSTSIITQERDALLAATIEISKQAQKGIEIINDPPVHFYAYESGQKVLDILKPNPSKKVKVYFLFYEDSTEVQRFETSICRENGAFESLIRQKSMMICHLYRSLMVDKVRFKMLKLVSKPKFLIKMPPRRNIDINNVYDRIMARMEERLDRFVDQS
ncbi:hypothetical protein Tco_1341580 [Tanacetum coccineum]